MSDFAKRATIRDVAVLSGVSSQTVSRVINGDAHVSKKTRQRVQKAIDDLNYRPNRAAQSLVTRRSRTLEIITFGTPHYGPSQMVANVQAEAKALGYNLILSSISNTTSQEIRAAIDNLSGRLIAALILTPPILAPPSPQLTTSSHIPPLLPLT